MIREAFCLKAARVRGLSSNEAATYVRRLSTVLCTAFCLKAARVRGLRSNEAATYVRRLSTVLCTEPGAASRRAGTRAGWYGGWYGSGGAGGGGEGAVGGANTACGDRVLPALRLRKSVAAATAEDDDESSRKAGSWQRCCALVAERSEVTLSRCELELLLLLRRIADLIWLAAGKSCGAGGNIGASGIAWGAARDATT
ncbi:hypothetical protein VOLCADRAFT_87520 [Volvox carteri f. nagariensis]|uniref:Uncharacterized protein n=1 Tax=Volvox carteri f. nagariensis TaxID=3068 RepID=D8TLI7_VOLCA|nr:uncharacterized protein VOLCADRAFT_87520 [Volvox carteri f. nagariensis]EFJ51741.1 hypothetical protein VOLCADRAFT_87520 [Volvox carteri f. nagariensis]|eukprot:XP_002947151.1 hypothetical protein VOLCADRAFT_87520 [Volvox carteri f. nagariensis]